MDSFTKSVIHSSDRFVVKPKRNLYRLAAVHFERPLGVSGHTLTKFHCLFADVFVDDLYRIHPVNAAIGSIVVLGTVYHQIVVIFVEYQSYRLHNIVVAVSAIDLLAIGIQIVVTEDDLLVLFDGIF